jgi:hypothetical protein
MVAGGLDSVDPSATFVLRTQPRTESSRALVADVYGPDDTDLTPPFDRRLPDQQTEQPSRAVTDAHDATSAGATGRGNHEASLREAH